MCLATSSHSPNCFYDILLKQVDFKLRIRFPLKLGHVSSLNKYQNAIKICLPKSEASNVLA